MPADSELSSSRVRWQASKRKFSTTANWPSSSPTPVRRDTPPQSRHRSLVGEGWPACRRNRQTHLGYGPRPERPDFGCDRTARLGCQEEKRPHDSPSRRSRYGPRVMDDGNLKIWASHSFRAGRPDDSDQRRQLVQDSLPEARPCRLQLSFGPAHVHHAGGAAGPQSGRFVARRSTARRPSINPDNPTLH